MILFYSLNAIVFAVVLLLSGANMFQVLIAAIVFAAIKLGLFLLNTSSFMSKLMQNESYDLVGSSFKYIFVFAAFGLIAAYSALGLVAFSVAFWKLLIISVVMPYVEMFTTED